MVILENDIMGPSFDYASGGYQGQLGFFAQFADGESTAIAHGGTYFLQGKAYIVF